MQILLYIFFYFFLFYANANSYIMEDTAAVEKIATISLPDDSEFSTVSIIGHWSDNLGNFGISKCYGYLESKKKITLVLDVLCEKETLRGSIFTRGGRKESLQEAGVGYLKIINAEGDFEILTGSSCKYGVFYYKNAIQYTTKCDVDDATFKKLKGD